MTEKRFLLEITTPEENIYSEHIYSLRVPAHEGDLGVLPGHAPLLASLKPGIIRIKKNEGDETVNLYSITGGFLDVTPERTVVLADAAEHPEELNIDRAREAYIRAFNRLYSADEDSEIDRERARQALNRARARLKTAKKAGKDAEVPKLMEQ